MINQKVWVALVNKSREPSMLQHWRDDYGLTDKSEGFILNSYAYVIGVHSNIKYSVVFEGEGVILELYSKYLKVIRVDVVGGDEK